jgi:hypothetical protein
MVASASINNMHVGSALLLMNVTSYNPAAQRNFWAKSSSGNRNAAFMNNASGGTIAFQYGAGTGGTLMQASALASSFPNVAAGAFAFLGFSWSQGGAILPQLWGGSLTMPLAEVTAYVAQTAGAAGSPNHDDSAADMGVFSGSGVGTASCPGEWALAVYWRDQLTIAALRLAQAAVLDGVPIPFAPAVVLVAGAHGTTRAIDQSGNGNHGEIITATQSGTLLPGMCSLTTMLPPVHQHLPHT